MNSKGLSDLFKITYIVSMISSLSVRLQNKCQLFKHHINQDKHFVSGGSFVNGRWIISWIDSLVFTSISSFLMVSLKSQKLKAEFSVKQT